MTLENIIQNIKKTNTIIFQQKNIDLERVILETDQYDYKIYSTSIKNYFIIKIRQILSKIYTQKYHIDFQLTNIYNNNEIIQIEKSQKLKKINNIRQNILIQNFYKMSSILEKQLKFDEIYKKLKQYKECKDLSKIKLLTEFMCDTQNYRLTKNNEIILYDDTNWFIAMLDTNNNWLKLPYKIFELDQNHAITNYLSCDKIKQHLPAYINKWLPFKIKKGSLQYQQAKQSLEQDILNNIKILTS